MTKKVNIMTDAGADVGTINEAVSARIKQYRRQQKMSLDELSRRAGVSKGMLVEIEGCKANPSIALLCRLAAAMGVSVADFVNVSSTPPVHLITPADIPVLWEGKQGGTARLVAGSAGPDMVELWQWVMEPGEQFYSPGHPEGTFELLYVLRGTLDLNINNHAYSITPGSSAVARTDVPHVYENTGEARTVFMMTVCEKGR